MNEHVSSGFRSLLNSLLLARGMEDDYLAREQAQRERHYEQRRAAHPDPSDPDHPDELEEML